MILKNFYRLKGAVSLYCANNGTMYNECEYMRAVATDTKDNPRFFVAPQPLKEIEKTNRKQSHKIMKPSQLYPDGFRFVSTDSALNIAIDGDLGKVSFRILFALQGLTSNDGCCDILLADLARLLKLPPSNVRTAMNQLIDRKLVYELRGDKIHRNRRYWLLSPNFSINDRLDNYFRCKKTGDVKRWDNRQCG